MAFNGYLRANILSNRLPGPQPTNWLLGMEELMYSPNTAHTQLKEWAKEYGDIYRVRVLHKQFVVVSSPEKVTRLLSKDLSLSKSQATKVLNEVTNSKKVPNLFTLETSDPLWKLSRKRVEAAFTAKHLRRGFDTALYYSNQLVSILSSKEAQEHVHMDQLLTMLALEVIAKFGFNIDLGVLKEEFSLVPGMNVRQDYADGSSEANARMFDPLRRYRWWNQSVQHGEAVYQRLHRLNHALLAECRLKIESGEVSEHEATIAGALLGLRHPDTGLPLDDEELASHVGVLFMAGHSTIGSTICYVLYLLSTHPQVEARLVAELQDAGLMKGRVTAFPRSLCLEDLPKMTYLQAVVKESMRLLPSASLVGRYADEDILLDGHLIPAGSDVLVSMSAMNRIYFKDGDSFHPERWLEDPKAHLHIPSSEDGKTNFDNCLKNTGCEDSALVSPAAPGVDMKANEQGFPKGPPVVCKGGRLVKRFMPYADGPRECVGQSLASVVVPTTLVCLLANFRYELEPGFDHGSLHNNAIISRPVEVRMRVIPRSA